MIAPALRHAWIDAACSASGLALVLFMWGHMLFVSSILLGPDAMWTVTRAFEGYFVLGRSEPALVSAAVAAVAALFAFHAVLALRRLPPTGRGLAPFARQTAAWAHEDTVLWWLQLATGVVMIGLGGFHLAEMYLHPEDIGPYASADGVWTGGRWPAHLALLLAVEVHATVGLYRLAVKWGWPAGPDPETTRRRLKRVMWALIAFLLLLGSLTLATYVRIGIEHADRAGERYVPTWQREVPR